MSRANRIAILLTVAFGLFFVAVSRVLPNTGALDLLEYWAAAKLFLAGSNPYDANLLLAVQRAVRPLSEPVIIWNPPWLLPLLLPIAPLALAAARLVWLSLSLAATSAAFSLTASGTSLSTRQGLFWATAAITFIPIHLSLYYGQVSIWLLVGWAGFLACLRAGGSARLAAAGALLALTLFKPHLLYLVFLYLAFGLARPEARKIAAGGALVSVGLSLAAIVIQPRIFEWYFEVTQAAPPLYWQTPTLGSWLQLVTDKHAMWIRVLPSIVTALVLVPWMARRRGALDTQTLLVLLPLSLLTSPYGWHFDHVLLLPGCFFVVTLGIRRNELTGDSHGLFLALAALGVNLIDALPVFPHAQQYSIWFPAAHLLLLLYATRLERVHPLARPMV